jgi:polygalacturonase
MFIRRPRRHFLKFLLPLSTLPLLSAGNTVVRKGQNGAVFAVKSKYNGTKEETENIQSAIDAANAAGGGRVEVTAGTYLVGSIRLLNDVHLHFESGAVWIATPDFSQYHEEAWKRVLYAYQARNIKISGYGLIDCKAWFKQETPVVSAPYAADAYVGLSFKNEGAPRPFFLHDCHDCEVSDIKLQNSGEWSCYLLACDHVVVRNVHIHNSAHSRWTDGIDIESCNNVHITGCNIDTGDDAISIKSAKRGTKRSTSNILIEHCTLASETNGVRLGTETFMDVYNVRIENCLIKGPTDNAPGPFSGINLTMTRGHANLSNITVRNIKMQDCRAPFFLALQAVSEEAFEQGKIGAFRNVTLENIEAENNVLKDQPDITAMIIGSEKQPIEQVILRNIVVRARGGFRGQATEKAEVKGTYSENKRYHPVPAKGLYLRHVDGLVVENFRYMSKEEDDRPVVFKNNVRNERRGE